MKRKIEKVAVIGAGVMGSGIAAHCANARFTVDLLDVVPQNLSVEEAAKGLKLSDPEVRNRIVKRGLDTAVRAKPAALFSPGTTQSIRIGNLEDDFPRLAAADWIIEAVTENFDIKASLLRRIDAVRQADTIVSTNTSGISINRLSQGLTEGFRRHWLGTHFFNPPRYMKLLEIIPGRETESWILDLLADIADRRLGKGIVFAKDTPNFIANRIGTFGLQHILKLVREGGYGIDEVDQWTGPLIGRPKSATFRTLDIVGIDTFAHVTRNIQEAAPDDEQRSIFCVPDFVKEMVELNLLGDKTGGGFYKRVSKNEILSLSLPNLVYEPRQKIRFAALDMIKTMPTLAERLRRLTSSTDRAGSFLWENLSATITYAAMRIPEISDDITHVDHAMQWGFNWELGPFQIWDALGVEHVAKRLEKEQKIIPQLIQDLLSSSIRSFYNTENGHTTYFDCLNKAQKRLEHPRGILLLPDLKRQNRVILDNSSASLVDLGDGVACVEFHSKMNTIGGDTIQMIYDSLKLAEQNYRGLVIGNQGQNFSAGANLMLILLEAQNQNWEDIDDMIRAFQRVNQAIKYAAVPVVAAPFGLTLGGGCEICLHAAERVAAAETYIGLVELGVGLIPAAGGTKEMLLRSMTAISDPEADLFPTLKEIFENIALARVSGSADEARTLKFLSIQDEICMNRYRLIERAKARVMVLADAGCHKPVEPKITALGVRGLATFKIGMHQMRRGGLISDFDQLLGSKLAYVLCGGDCNSVQQVTEQYILDLEREVFLSLCGERKTQERIQYMLQNGKSLRN